MQLTRRSLVIGTLAMGACSSADVVGSGTGGLAQTVLGPVDVARLGFVLSHEHLAGSADVLSRWPDASVDREDLVEKTSDALMNIRVAGIGTIVDLTPYDAGRDISFLADVSRACGIHIIACTGQRFFQSNSQYEMPSPTIEGQYAFFRGEIEEGIDETGIKAGVIKIGIAEGEPTDLENVGLRAAVRASKATGIPIRIHANAAQRAGENIAVVLEDENVDPARVAFDHSDDSGVAEYLLGLARRGYSLSMDHVHRGLESNLGPSFERRAECIKLLIDAGFANRVFLSQDSMIGGWVLPDEAKNWREKDPWDPPEGLLFVTERLIPYLNRLGVSEQSIRIMTVEHPKAFYTRI